MKPKNKNVIYLKFNLEQVAVSGERYGRKIYKKCVKPFFREDLFNVIIFPEQVEYITISFIKGLIKEFQKKYNTKNNFFEHIDFEAKNNSIMDLYKKIKETVSFLYPADPLDCLITGISKFCEKENN